MLCQTFNDVFAMLVDDFEHCIAQQDALRLDPFDAGTSAQMLVSPRPMGRDSCVRANGDRCDAIRARIRAAIIARDSVSGKTGSSMPCESARPGNVRLRVNYWRSG